MTGWRVFLPVLLTLGIAMAGCLFKESAMDAASTPTATALATQAPAAGAQENASEESTPLPSEKANATTVASPEPSPTPGEYEGGEKAECALSVNPADAPGPFKSLLAAKFFNYPDPGDVTIKCTSQDAGTAAEKRGELYYAQCEYPYVFERKLLTASASAGFVTCATTVVIQGNPQFAKAWTFSPGDEAFDMNKTDEPRLTREYSITNTGTLVLAGVKCTTDKAWAAVGACPASLAIGEQGKIKITYDASSLENGNYNVQLTVSETNMNKAFSIGVTVSS